jgi:alkylation response protein AidB-like acyl-CoA dehydrogenase
VELEFTPEQEELRSSVRAVLARECPISVPREVVEKGSGAEALWARLASLDWPALTVPEENGGMGFGMVELAVLMEETGAVIAPTPLFSLLGLYVPLVREAGTAEQRERFLGPVAAGTSTGAAAIAGRGGGWEPEDVSVTGMIDGAEVVLSGTSYHVLDATQAAEFVVAARFEDGVGLVVVPRTAVTPVAVRPLDGTRPTSSVPLDGVRVGVDRRLGGPGDRSEAWRRALDEATAALSLELVGTCGTIFNIALDYAKMREQFGVKIGSFQAIKHKLADMFVALEAAQSMAYFASAAIAEDDARRSLAASMAKALAGDCERRVAQEGIQILGGIGYTWEHDMHLYVKRAMASSTLLGNAEHHRARVASLLGVA